MESDESLERLGLVDYFNFREHYSLNKSINFSNPYFLLRPSNVDIEQYLESFSRKEYLDTFKDFFINKLNRLEKKEVEQFFHVEFHKKFVQIMMRNMSVAQFYRLVIDINEGKNEDSSAIRTYDMKKKEIYFKKIKEYMPFELLISEFKSLLSFHYDILEKFSTKGSLSKKGIQLQARLEVVSENIDGYLNEYLHYILRDFRHTDLREYMRMADANEVSKKYIIDFLKLHLAYELTGFKKFLENKYLKKK